MKASFSRPRSQSLGKPPKPALSAPTDAIVKIAKTTICGSDLHHLKGDVLVVTWARPGSRGFGVVESVGPGRYCGSVRRSGAHLLHQYCWQHALLPQAMYSHCTSGGWILGNEIDRHPGRMVAYPYADCSLYHVRKMRTRSHVDAERYRLTHRVRVRRGHGKVQPGSTVSDYWGWARSDSRPCHLPVLFAGKIIVIDLDDNRLEAAKNLGATAVIRAQTEMPRRWSWADRRPRGRTVIEAVGTSATFDLCTTARGARRHHRQFGCMGRKWISIWSRCGTATSPSPQGWSIRSALPC